MSLRARWRRILDIPSPECLTYRPFQLAGIEYALARPATLIADDMGVGKTIEAIGVINATSPGRILIICPTSLSIHWERTLEAWTVPHYRIGIAAAKFPEDVDIVILPYSRVTKHADRMKSDTWD